MALPRSLVIPAVLAIIVAGLLAALLFWQLDRTRALLQGDREAQEQSDVLRRITPLPNVSTQGDDALSALRRGDLLALRGEWSEAEKEYKAAVDAGGGLTALRKLAQAQLQRRDIPAARTTLRQLRSAGARDEDLVLLEAIIHLRTGEFAEARALLEGAADSPQSQYGLSLLAIAENRHEDAKASLAKVLAGWEPTLRTYAKTLMEAYDEYALFDASPETHLWTLLSRALADVQECDIALPMLAKVLVAQDDYRDAWILQGYCQLTTERLAEARPSLERAYQIDPEKPEIQYFLARALSRLGDHAGAITYLQYAIENGFEPLAEARRLLAAEAYADGNETLALEHLDLLTREEGANDEAFMDFVAAAIAADKNEEAYARAQEGVKAFPQSAVAHEALGWAALETGRRDEARAMLEKAIELDPLNTSAKERLAKM